MNKSLDNLNAIETALPESNEEHIEFTINATAFDPDMASLELEEDLDDKALKYIEREVRSSYEYREYVSYLKNELDLTKCALLPNLDLETSNFRLEFHHYPFSLYEIAEIVGKQMINSLAENEKLSCFEIAERIVEEHYRGNVGLIPLTKTLHDMAHNKTIIIPISKVNGNYKKFIEKYNSSIDPDILQRISDAEMNSESDDSKAFNEAKLKKKIVDFDIEYIDVDDDSMEDNDE